MKIYKVLKEFPSSDGGYNHKKDSKYKPTQSNHRTNNLLRLGYIEEIPKQPKTVWDLKEDESCWAICWGTVYERVWSEEEDYAHMRAIGDIFLTKLEAEKELARRKAKQILLRDTKVFRINPYKDWYLVYYNYHNKKLHISQRSGTNNYGALAFATEEDAKASIKKHQEEWRTYLGVNDEEL